MRRKENRSLLKACLKKKKYKKQIKLYIFKCITNEHQIFNFENFERAQNYVKKRQAGYIQSQRYYDSMQLPYLSHELLLEGETKVRSWAHNGQDGGTHCYHSFRGSMPTQLDWVAANTAALVSDIIALQPFHFLKEHPPGKDCRNRFTIAMAESSVRRVNTARFLFPSPHHDLFVISNYWLLDYNDNQVEKFFTRKLNVTFDHHLKFWICERKLKKVKFLEYFEISDDLDQKC